MAVSQFWAHLDSHILHNKPDVIAAVAAAAAGAVAKRTAGSKAGKPHGQGQGQRAPAPRA